MKRSICFIISIVLSLVALFCLVSCANNDRKQTGANITPTPSPSEPAVPTSVVPNESATTLPTEDASAAPTDTAQPTPERTSPIIQRPENVTIEWLAGELMRRKYVSCIELELVDYSDIMDRNENTDLFFYNNQLDIDLIKLNLSDNFISATNHDTHIKGIVSESETEITVDLYVGTSIPSVGNSMGDYIGESFQITVDKQRMVIIAYGEPNGYASRYKSWLEPLALRYRNQGLSWEEANKKAYDEIFAEFVVEATEYPRQTP
ncbi:MAG: hypothetical protein IKS90_05890 [Clostridia bacterium]|nr:hypothetical protein [Clostridia bacterium]